MRILFVLIVLANVVLYGISQGWLGTPLAEEGRDSGRVRQELNANKMIVGK